MIHSQIDDQLLVVLNEADGLFSLADLRDAFESTRLLTRQGYGVIWDFRKLSLNDVDPKVLTTIGNTMRTMERELNPQKRAILVSTKEDQSQLDAFIGRTSVSWPWSVFLEFEEAMHWLRNLPVSQNETLVPSIR